MTLAGTWAPRRWLDLAAELMRGASLRDERTPEGLSARAIQVQGQFVARFLY